MDIQYLLFLQDFRNSIDNALTPFMEGVSMFAVTYLILFPVYYYWNRNKKDGLYALVAYYFCMVITPLVKLTACVYRPWIRDSRIVPAGKAIVTATGYSFPSGHTTTAVPLAGGMVVNTWKNPRLRVASVLFAAFIVLTMFSRNYLGVHTPQDVCVGFGVSVLSLFFTAKLFRFDFVDQQPVQQGEVNFLQRRVEGGRIENDMHSLFGSKFYDQRQAVDLVLQEQPVAPADDPTDLVLCHAAV